ncbi:flagellar basal body rod protein FlgB [Candidatus Njordibacter sp. Uisw_039]|jgi:flagellar basal-body rod protein FlgB|uniref:flagellar basal body rod protein FlgB n=1 Tax=Candidatus Njordibacter sp. Uisw_039 TaxID=3230972 RepID=UPI003A1292C8|tara:strand:+ start:14 stop:406 length:393 start_codon:yes stop_codon:yes gene_type:complete
MSILQNPLGIHATALKLREQRIGVLASNIANVDTPNYKARDIDFSSVMATTESNNMRTSHGRHIGVSNYQALQGDSMIKYRMPSSASLDGNTVEVNTENSLFTENSMRYQATNTFLNNRIKGVMSALRGE